ncbi:MAG: putative LPS assembly protein LptD, partial [Bacteroidia bacterium]|nr:putative LPS assembly protein LptD [Bacteroidia bacterium]
MRTATAFAQIPQDTLVAPSGDSLVVARDSIILDSLRQSAPFQDPIDYSAEDSMVLDLNARSLRLYGNAHLRYQSTELKAAFCVVEFDKSLMHASGVENEQGVLQGTPVFVEKGETYHAEKISYNFKTRKGKIDFARTNQNGDVVHGESIFRNPDDTYFIRGGKFTTCDAEHPHFYFRSNKLKVIPRDKIVSGPLYPVVADVPLPVVLPFGFFPFRQQKASGIIVPTFGEARDRGFFLRNLGLYWKGTQYFDLKLLGDVFSKGGFRIETQSRYRKIYSFDGTLRLEFSRQSFNERTDPDYSRTDAFFVTWRHNQFLTPQARLTADVNAGSSNFLRRNSFDFGDNYFGGGIGLLSNTLNSGVALSKRFPRAKLSLNVNLRQAQNLNQKTGFWAFPEIGLNKDRMTPFAGLRPKSAVGPPKWYEQIGVIYSSRLVNSVNAPDSTLFRPAFWRNVRSGITHNVSTNVNFKILRYVTLTPTLNFQEYWYPNSILNRTVVEVNDSAITTVYQRGGTNDTLRKDTTFVFYRTLTDTVRRVATARDFNASLALNTQLYGILSLGGRRKTTFRHTMQPNLSLNFRPDFSDERWGYYRTLIVEPTKGRNQKYSRFENSAVGGPAPGRSWTLNFGLNNVFEMKYLTDKDSAGKTKFKYVRILDALGVNGGYNFAADSLKLSPFSLVARGNVLDNKINLNFSGQLDPYALDGAGRRINTLQIKADGSIARLTNASAGLAFGLSSADFKSKTTQNDSARRDEYAPFRLPWTLNVNYTLNYSRPARQAG